MKMFFCEVQTYLSVGTMMKELGVEDVGDYKSAIQEILTQAFPATGSEVMNWDIDLNAGGDEGMGGMM